jgi:hypothetical protein
MSHMYIISWGTTVKGQLWPDGHARQEEAAAAAVVVVGTAVVVVLDAAESRTWRGGGAPDDDADTVDCSCVVHTDQDPGHVLQQYISVQGNKSTLQMSHLHITFCGTTDKGLSWPNGHLRWVDNVGEIAGAGATERESLTCCGRGTAATAGDAAATGAAVPCTGACLVHTDQDPGQVVQQYICVPDKRLALQMSHM